MVYSHNALPEMTKLITIPKHEAVPNIMEPTQHIWKATNFIINRRRKGSNYKTVITNVNIVNHNFTTNGGAITIQFFHDRPRVRWEISATQSTAARYTG